jgi:hypothetical protein
MTIVTVALCSHGSVLPEVMVMNNRRMPQTGIMKQDKMQERHFMHLQSKILLIIHADLLYEKERNRLGPIAGCIVNPFTPVATSCHRGVHHQAWLYHYNTHQCDSPAKNQGKYRYYNFQNLEQEHHKTMYNNECTKMNE